MEQTRQSVHVGAVERYLRRGEIEPQQAEHLRRVVAEASRTGEPIELHVHLPAEPQQIQAAPVRQHRDVDWTAIGFIGIPALLVLILASFIFVGCMSQPPPPPAPNVTTNPSCSSWCW